jgi:hypothetical protein
MPYEVDRVDAHLRQVQRLHRRNRRTGERDHDDGEVTATMKFERQSIAGKHADTIEIPCGGGPARTPEEQPT